MAGKLIFETYDKRTLRGRRYYWRLRAANGEIVAQGEGYNSAAGRDNGIRVVASTTAATPVVEVAK